MLKHRGAHKTLLILGLVITLATHPAGADESEAALKTAFLYNFLKLIEWPVSADQKAFHLCMTENDDLGNNLSILQHKSIRGRPIVIHRPVIDNVVQNCHLLFIANHDNVSAMIAKLDKQPVVTISDSSGFIDRGGMIGLVVSENNRLAFEVNLDRSKISGIRFNAQLLKLARRIINNP